VISFHYILPSQLFFGGILIVSLPERISDYFPTQETQQERKETTINKEK